jgi:quercetin dioxygenase-like cupin family protein
MNLVPSNSGIVTALTGLEPQAMAEALVGHPQIIDVALEHHFAPHLYGRKAILAAGTLAIGKKHRTTHLSVLAKGELIVRGVAGMPDHRMVAGDVMVTPAGSQRAVYAVEDSVFVCIHATDETDLEKLETQLIEPCGELSCPG